jgi:hypothetical protein
VNSEDAAGKPGPGLTRRGALAGGSAVGGALLLPSAALAERSSGPVREMEIIDAQIHEPQIGGGRVAALRPGETLSPEIKALINIELAREAVDSVGVDRALVFSTPKFCEAAFARYPDRFGGAVSFNPAAPDLEEQIAAFRGQPGMLACRVLLTNYSQAGSNPAIPLQLNPLVEQGGFDRYWALAAKYRLPMFFGAHAFAAKAAIAAERHPDLTIIIDHYGVTQSLPYRSPDRWRALPGLLSLARYPNVHVKLCSQPIVSEQAYPYADVWPHMHRILKAFGPERCMWASDFTRLRWGTETPRGADGMPPRKDWLPYSDALYAMLYSNEISLSDKQHIFGRTVRRALNWKD